MVYLLEQTKRDERIEGHQRGMVHKRANKFMLAFAWLDLSWFGIKTLKQGSVR